MAVAAELRLAAERKRSDCPEQRRRRAGTETEPETEGKHWEKREACPEVGKGARNHNSRANKAKSTSSFSGCMPVQNAGRLFFSRFSY